ncbi:MAG: RHS repeat protein, partial [Gammaproteobacteria bacterium]|nr:RHS repeat protein [Gammaproteobacteria bacterium]
SHYDPMGRLASHQVSHQHNKQTIIQRGYAYDHAGNLSTIDDLKKGATHYQYDALNRLAQVKSFVSEQFTFDPAGNLLAQQSTQDSSAQSTQSTPSATPQVSGNRLAFLGDRKFEYDTYGNLVKEQRGKGGQLQTEFTYNASNQLVKVTKNNSGKQEEYSYRYDALGRRINKTTPEQSIDFMWNGDVLLSETISGQSSKLYLYEPNSFKPLAVVQDTEIYHYHLDHLGTPQEITRHNGELAWSVQYKAYGNVVRKEVESIENNLRFQGQYYDAVTNLHYNRHRYYHHTRARF